MKQTAFYSIIIFFFQYEFGNQPVGQHKRISANKSSKIEKIENDNRKSPRKLSQERRRLNSELSDMNPELASTPTNAGIH